MVRLNVGNGFVTRGAINHLAMDLFVVSVLFILELGFRFKIFILCQGFEDSGEYMSVPLVFSA